MNLEDEIQRRKREIDQVNKTIEQAKKLTHLEQYGVVNWAIYPTYIAAYIAPGPDYARLRRALGSHWRRHRSHQDKNGNVYINLRNDDAELTIIIDSDLANGKTCQRVKIGEIIQPIYKVVCQ